MKDLRVVAAPDSLKGSLSSTDLCAAIVDAFAEAYPDAEVDSIPMADGGEGTVDAMIAALSGKKIAARSSGPFGDEIDAAYGDLGGGSFVVEMASCAGLPLAEGRLDVMRSTTFGVGSLIRSAIDRGAKKILLGLGGSATNDCGCGMASALGARFFDRDGRVFTPTGATLADVDRIDASALREIIDEVEVVAMTDVDAVMTGPFGAASLFGPQKGASAEDIRELDRGAAKLCRVIARDLAADVEELPGSGAAGGMGGGAVALLGAKITGGAEAVLDAAKFEDRAKGASCVITGEGRIDATSARGKAVAVVSRRARRLGVPTIAIVGGAAPDLDVSTIEGLSAVFVALSGPATLDEAKARAREGVLFAARSIASLIREMGDLMYNRARGSLLKGV